MAIAAPTFAAVGWPQYLIPFSTAIPNLAILSFVSSKIPFPFRITAIAIWNNAALIQNIQVHIFTSGSSTVSPAQIPADTNILIGLGPVGYLLATAAGPILPLNFIAPEGDHYIKVSIENLSGGAGLVQVLIWIEAV